MIIIPNKSQGDLIDYSIPVNTVENIQTIDLLAWNKINKILPLMAHLRLQDKNLSEIEILRMEKMTKPEWWKEHFLPIYAFSKMDTKYLLVNTKSLDSESEKIVALKSISTGVSKQEALKTSEDTYQFIKDAILIYEVHIYISYLRNLITDLEARYQKRLDKNKTQINLSNARVEAILKIMKLISMLLLAQEILNRAKLVNILLVC